MSSTSSIDAEHGQTASHRHTYPGVSTPDLADSAPASPLTLPALLHSNDEDSLGFSPTSSAGILTPPLGSLADRARVVSEHHNALNSLAFGASPDLDSVAGSFDKRPAYPLLPAHKTLRVAPNGGASSTISLDNSPPSTPKGHPISSFRSSPFFPLSSVQSAQSALGKPRNSLSGAAVSAASGPLFFRTPTVRNLLSRYTRIPRRYRPLLLLGFCLVTFVVILFTPSATPSHAAMLNSRLATGSKRYVRNGAAAVADFAKGRMPVLAPSAGASRPSAVHGAQPIQFENTAEEIAALIAVSPLRARTPRRLFY